MIRTSATEYMTIVIVGGGPTGVELAGLIPDVLRGIRRDFRRIDPTRARVILIEGGPRLLAAFPQEMSDRALSDLRELGVDVRLDSVVTRVERTTACIGSGECIRDANDFLGCRQRSVAACAIARRTARSCRTRSRAARSCRFPDHPEVFVVGDMATLTDVRGVRFRGVAPAANQQGKRAAENIKLLIA